MFTHGKFRGMKPSFLRTLYASLLPLLLLAATPAFAQDAKATQDSITGLLKEFLARNDEAAEHDRFWAADLVYTSSKGEVIGKADIMKSFDGAKPDPAQPTDTYSAEDILVRPYGTTAALTFRLIRHGPDGKLHQYRNSGTLLLRDGRWQVVTWQATKLPDEDEKPSK
jgi:hypothetical protein